MGPFQHAIEATLRSHEPIGLFHIVFHQRLEGELCGQVQLLEDLIGLTGYFQIPI